MIPSAHRPPIKPSVSTCDKDDHLFFLKALLNVRLTQFVRKCTTISSPHGPEIWSGFKHGEDRGEVGFFFEDTYSNEGIKLPLTLTYRVARALRGGLCFPSKS